MNSLPLNFFTRPAQGPPMTRRRPRTQQRAQVVPAEVNAARAFARLAGLDLDELGVTGRPTCTQPEMPHAPAAPRARLPVVVMRRAVAWAGAFGNKVAAALRRWWQG